MDVGRKHDSGETAVAEGASQVALVVKNLPAKSGNIRDVGSILSITLLACEVSAIVW